MINAILTGIFNLIISLVNIILSPIDNLITSSLPSLSNAFDNINQIFTIVNNGVGFAISMSGLSDTALDLIVTYWVFVLTVPFTFSSIKLAIKWYNSLKV